MLDCSSPNAALLARTAVVALETFLIPSAGYSVLTRAAPLVATTRFIATLDGTGMLDVDAFVVLARDVPLIIVFSSVI